MTRPNSIPGGPFLALDTSSPVGGVALGRGANVLAEIELGEPTRHAERLLPAIEQVLSGTGCRDGGVAAIVVGAGPGSFTGVRIAASTAKALVHAWKVPLKAWSSLAMLAAGGRHVHQPVVALFDARRAEVYGACYRFPEGRPETILDPVALSIDALLSRVPRGALFVGEGALLHEDRIRAAGGSVVHGPGSVPRPASLLWLAERYPEVGIVSRPASWEPEYVRASGAQRMQER